MIRSYCQQQQCCFKVNEGERYLILDNKVTPPALEIIHAECSKNMTCISPSVIKYFKRIQHTPEEWMKRLKMPIFLNHKLTVLAAYKPVN